MDILSRWFDVQNSSMVYAMALALATSVACDKKSEPSDPSGGSSVPPVSAGSRLGWTQTASTLLQAQSMGFRLYVDGSPVPLVGTCTQGSTQGRYDCSGILPSMSPGRHTLEVASLLNGMESPRSAPLRINFSSLATSLPDSDASSGGASTAPQSSAICLTTTARCHDDTAIASGFADVIGLSALPDGRLLFIEGGRRVRVIENKTLRSDPALSAPAEATLAGLAVDSRFETTRFVYIAWSEAKSSGEHSLNITRYRELAGTLGEGAQIVTNLPFQADARAPLAVDSAGLLYVATPTQPQRVGSDALGAGAILRFTRDGAVAAGSWRGSSIVAYGYPRPTGLVVDSALGALWLAGIDASRVGQMARVALQSEAVSRMTEVGLLESVAQPLPAQNAFEPTLTALSPSGGDQQASVVVAADGQLLQGLINARGTIDGLVPLATGQPLPLRAAAQSADGSLYVVAGENGQMSVLHLTDWR
jgi:glucose/sorbosone dehydrogenase